MGFGRSALANSVVSDVDATLTPTEIDVTVIGGYLGAGKTTLVNHVLRTATERIAVLVNDFGDVNIDLELIADHDGATISLTNGCICCSLVDGFAAALANVRAAEPAPDRLVIEASGVADPASVAAYGHAPGLRLDATIVVVDAETVRERARDAYVGDTVIAQLRSADIIVLNKLDLVASEAAGATRSWLMERAPGAAVVDAVESAVDPRVLFGSIAAPAAATATDTDTDGPGPRAEDRYESWTWTCAEPVPRATIVAFVESLPEGVVRAKGVLFLAEDAERAHVLQSVGSRWSLRPSSDAATTSASTQGGPPDRTSRLVVIGRRGALDHQAMAGALDHRSR